MKDPEVAEIVKAMSGMSKLPQVSFDTETDAATTKALGKCAVGADIILPTLGPATVMREARSGNVAVMVEGERVGWLLHLRRELMVVDTGSISPNIGPQQEASGCVGKTQQVIDAAQKLYRKSHHRRRADQIEGGRRRRW